MKRMARLGKERWPSLLIVFPPQCLSTAVASPHDNRTTGIGTNRSSDWEFGASSLGGVRSSVYLRSAAIGEMRAARRAGM